MHTIIKTMPAAKTDNRTRPERQAAKALGVKIKTAVTEVRSVYGSTQHYAQAFRTDCGNVLVIDTDSETTAAALCTSDFDWNESVHNDAENYRGLAEAAGLR